MADDLDDLGIPKRLVRPATVARETGSTSQPPSTVAAPMPAAPPPLPTLPRFLSAQPANVTASAQSANGQPTDSKGDTVEAKTLIVGQGISLSGEIKSCSRLVVEGSVQANLQACQSMIIAETGLFDGNAAIDDADIYGRFEGDLAVRKRLLIRASGEVSGTITYGKIEVEAGGKIAGSIQSSR